MRYCLFIGLFLLSCLDKTPETKCDGMDDLTKVIEEKKIDKQEDSLFGNKKADEGCKAL